MSSDKKPGKEEQTSEVFLEAAYAVSTKRETLEFYKDWASSYDTQLENLGYTAPALIADILARHLRDRDGQILDVGCGTGLTGLALQRHGFLTIDGLDFSQDMLDESQSRCLYRQLMLADLTQTLAIADGTYDAAVSSGTFTHGHVDADALDEIVRIIKPGGHLACTVNMGIWESAGFANKIPGLVERHRVTVLVEQDAGLFDPQEVDGRYYLMQKC
ncbi:MAG: class I SAM-dependent methyltransferase [Halieaceae bacterium]|jgi:predicted TPR repeat methyltransferase|nr:class I SAM-dependent methyltransferase [Halieaceae bacterium]